VYAANFESDLPDQRLVQVNVDIGGHLFFQKFKLMDPRGTGYMNNEHSVPEGTWLGVQCDHLAYGRFPDIPDPGHFRVIGRPVFLQGRGENVPDMNQFAVV
jgi:hypothetical protein